MGKIYLIIPDLHHKWKKAEKIIESVKADEIIFLGDYFDDYNDTPEIVEETCNWLISSVSKPNRIHLFGNHDQHYAFPYKTFQCSGYKDWKYFIIRDLINSKIWDKLKWFYFLDDKWLLTHAGLAESNVPDSIKRKYRNREEFIKELTDWLNEEIKVGFYMGADGVKNWIFNAGYARGGEQLCGGITWCDFNREFSPIKGINQIFGHTPLKFRTSMWCILNNRNISYIPSNKSEITSEMFNNLELSLNINLDVIDSMHWAIWNGKELIVDNYNNL